VPAAPQQHSSQFKITIGGPLPDPVVSSMTSAFVDNSANLPDMFSATFRDTERTVVAAAKIKMAAPVKVKVFSDAFPGGEPIFDGEVTAIEAEHDVTGTLTTVRAMDKSHRLFRGRITKAYLNMSYADVARAVAGRAGLMMGTITPSTPVHEHITQANVSDWQFLKGLASEIGYEVGVVDGKFVFRKPTMAASGPAAGNLKSTNPLQLVLGQNLIQLRSVISAAEQVPKVQVRAWDMKKKAAVVGNAPAKAKNAVVGMKPAQVAGKFKAKPYVSSHVPFETVAAAKAAATALAEQLAGSMAEVEGVARGNPKLRAGTVVSLGLLNAPFDGKYLLTSTRHVYDPIEGYTVWFTVSGAQERSMFGLAGAGGANAIGPNHPVNGVVTGIVTNNNDPQLLGRVKLKFPWLEDTFESGWARMVSAGAGKDRGTVIIPEVNDEVLVAFEHGDVRRPYVLGGLFNGKDKPKLGTALIKMGKVERRGYISKKGHQLIFFDGMAKSGVMLSTANKAFRISLNALPKMSIRVVSKGKVEIEAMADVKIVSTMKVEIVAPMVDIKAATGVSIDGGAAVVIKGAIIKLN
jgi:phage protein D